jgi:hypothetical protein
MEPLRTTLTLDPDVAAQLRETAAALGLGWKETVNRVLRAGLEHARAEPAVRPRFSTPVFQGGELLLPGIHSVHEMLALAEGDDYR